MVKLVKSLSYWFSGEISVNTTNCLNSTRIPLGSQGLYGVPYSSHQNIIRMIHKTLPQCKWYMYGDQQDHFETKRGEASQNTYLVVTVGYLVDFWFVVLFIF